jgi:hypothetical protein
MRFKILSLDNKNSPIILIHKIKIMKSFIRHKQVYYFFLTLHVIFLSMPVCHAGDIVLCYSETGQIKMDFRLSEECSCCNKSILDSQVKDQCYCVDIPISKAADEHSALLSNRTIQARPHMCLQPQPITLIHPSTHDGVFASVNSPYCTSPTHESLRTTVLLI